MLKLHRVLISPPWILSLADQAPFFYALEHAIVANPTALLGAVGGVLSFTYGVYENARRRRDQQSSDAPSRFEQELLNRITTLEHDKGLMQQFLLDAIEQRNERIDHVEFLEREIDNLRTQIGTQAIPDVPKEPHATD